MKKMKKLWKILSVVLVIALISVAGIAVYAFYGPPPITFNLLTDKETYQLGEPVNITITLKNQAPWPITVSCSLWCDFHIKDESGDVYSPGFLYYPGWHSFTLSSLELKSNRFTWKQVNNLKLDGNEIPVTAGTYKIVASPTFEYNGREYRFEREVIIIIQGG
ncbi:MAG: hypothetical protein U9O89_00695 [Thermoproteota archaeon]|nr:hypothetical protein [Thermoproteota archaeon]